MAKQVSGVMVLDKLSYESLANPRLYGSRLQRLGFSESLVSKLQQKKAQGQCVHHLNSIINVARGSTSLLIRKMMVTMDLLSKGVHTMSFLHCNTSRMAAFICWCMIFLVGSRTVDLQRSYSFNCFLVRRF